MNLLSSKLFEVIRAKVINILFLHCYCAVLPFMLAHTEGRVSSGDSTDSTGTKDMAELYSSV